MITTNNALAGIAVKNLDAAIRWYERILGRSPDAQPMPGLADWEFSGGGWIQVFEDETRAGFSSVTLVEDNLENRLAELRNQDIAIGATSSGDFIKTAIVRDPDGNQIVFAEAVDPVNRAATA